MIVFVSMSRSGFGRKTWREAFDLVRAFRGESGVFPKAGDDRDVYVTVTVRIDAGSGGDSLMERAKYGSQLVSGILDSGGDVGSGPIRFEFWKHQLVQIRMQVLPYARGSARKRDEKWEGLPKREPQADKVRSADQFRKDGFR